MAKTVTSVRIDEDLWKKAKHYAIDNGITLTELLEQALKEKIMEDCKKDE